jgi:hypothetical protein
MKTRENMLAYHGDPKIKRKYLARVRAHQKADELLQGYGYWRNGKGCAVGCTVHCGDHGRYPVELGIPAEIAYLKDSIFDGMDKKLAQKWPARFLSAIKPGADLSRVYDLWCAWMLDDPIDGVITRVSDDYPEMQKIVRKAAQDCRNGKRINAAEAKRAVRAERATWVTWVAWAARAARAVEATWAAEAARTARNARAASAAKQADKLIELLKAAPVRQ